MNRVIKFRVWDTKLNKWYPNTISLDINNVLTDGADSRFIVMQFTGLHDKNGKEIYEEDIVQHDAWDCPFEVIFYQEKARFVCRLKSGLTLYIDYEQMVVIGNIHENPELIKSK